MDSPLAVLTPLTFDKEVLLSEQPVLVAFMASWSGNCHLNEPVIQRIAEDYGAKVKVCKIFIEENDQLGQDYRIREFPTFLFFSHGEMIDRMSGVTAEFEIIEKLESILKDTNGEKA